MNSEKSQKYTGVNRATLYSRYLAVFLVVLIFGGWQAMRSIQHVRAQAGAHLYLGSARQYETLFKGPDHARGVIAGRPSALSMAAGDLDGDGMTDLAVGFPAPEGGVIAIHRGNLDAFAPQSEKTFWAIARGDFPSPYLPEANLVEIPTRPDFLAEGDLIGLKGSALAAAARGGSTISVLSRDDSGVMQLQQTLTVPGSITAMDVHDLARAKYAQLVVGVHTATGSHLLIYGGSHDGLSQTGDFPLSGDATSFVSGNLDSEGKPALLAVAGGQVSIVHSGSQTLETVSTPFTVSRAATGRFLHDRGPLSQMALLATDGSLHIMAPDNYDSTPYTLEELKANRRARINQRLARKRPNPNVQAAITPAPAARRAVTWKEVESNSGLGVPEKSGVTPLMFRTRISDSPADDVMLLGPTKLLVLAHPTLQPMEANVMNRGDLGDDAVAALSVRVNIDGRPGVVYMERGQTIPHVMMPLPDPTFTVNRNDDPNPPSSLSGVCAGVANDCSLREAVLKANATSGTDTIMVPNGTYTLSIQRIANPVYDARTGTLDVTDSVNIVGGGQTTTIIQAGTTQANGVDKVFSFNQDITAFTNATVSVSSLTIQNGNNKGDFHANFDGAGGAFDCDTGSSGNASVTLTNVTLTNNLVNDGEGGGFATFNDVHPSNQTGMVTVTNSIISNNTVSNSSPDFGDGGGIFVADSASLTMTGTTVSGNKTKSNEGGGGISDAGSGFDENGVNFINNQVTLHGVTITGNTAGTLGGGLLSNGGGLTIDQESIISNNTATGDGGGLQVGIYTDSAFAAFSVTFSNITVTGNSTNGGQGTGFGGGIKINGGISGRTGDFSMQYSRISGNTGTSAEGQQFSWQGTSGAAITVTDNWWGTNADPTSGANPAIKIDTNGASSGTINFNPWIVFTLAQPTSPIKINTTTGLTADIAHDSNGATSGLSGHLAVFNDLPVTFSSGSGGSITTAQPVTFPGTLGSNTSGSGTVTSTFQAGGSGASVTASATFDGVTVSKTIVVLQPPTMTKSFSPGKIVLNTGVSTLTFSVNNGNTVPIDANFTDTFTNGLEVATVPNASTTCVGSTWAPAANATSVTFSNATLPVGSCTIKVDVKGTTETTVNNTATLDSVAAGNATVAATASLVVYVPPVLAIAKTHSGTFTQGQTATWTVQVTNTSASTTGTTDGTTVTVSDTLPTGYTLSSGTGTNWSCSGNNTNVATCTSTAVVNGNGGLFPPITLTVNVPANSPTSVNNTAKVFGGGDVVHTNIGTAASGSDNNVPVVQVPASISINGTATQSAVINTAFGSLAVTVKDAGGVVIPNYSSVVFTAPASGQSGTFDNATNTKTLVTNGSGVADPGTFTANGTAGAYTVDVAAGPAPHASFHLTNTAPDLTIAKAHVGTGFTQSQNGAQYTLTVSNIGAGASSGTITVTDTLPTGLTFVSGAGGGFSCSAVLQVVTCTSTTPIAATNGTAAITLNVNVAANAPTSLQNSAVVACTCTESNTGNNTSNTDTVTVTQVPTQLILSSGSGQSATVNTNFGASFVALVEDAGNNPVPGVNVTFTAPTGAVPSAISTGNSTNTITVSTNAQGLATALYKANTIAGGPYNVSAASAGLTTVNFSETNLPGAAASVTANTGSGQSATINTAFGTVLTATVKDSFGNPVPGITVTFTAPAQTLASATFAGGTITATTNASGQATSVTVSANSHAGGPYNVVASAPGATSANFSLTNLVGAAATLAVSSGSGQSATINSAFTNPLVALVTDSGGNPVSGVVVTFTAPAQTGASATFAGGTITATTNASGLATSVAVSANGHVGGPYNVVASAPGATPVNFTLTNTAGSAATVAVSSGSGQSAAINTAFTNPLVALVTDSGGNPVSGVVVTFTAPAQTGASATFAGGTNTATTNASGLATSVVVSANGHAGGPYNVTAATPGATSATFSLTNTGGSAATVAVSSGSGQSATISTAFTNPLVALVTDAGGNPVSGVVVTFTAPAQTGASATFAGGTNTATTNASGLATSVVVSANSHAGGSYNVVASAPGATTSANFTLTNTVGSAATVAVSSGSGQSAAINTSFASPLVALVTDSGGNPVSGVVVTFTAPAQTGASATFAGGTNTATTNASGLATSVAVSANGHSGGPYNVVASAPGATSANFTLTNTAGSAATVAVSSGSGQSAVVTAAFTNPLVALVTDAGGNPVSGVVVTFTAPAQTGASATFAGGTNTATTNASGLATSVVVSANGNAGGPYNVVASAPGATTSANFMLTNTDTPATITNVTSTNANGSYGVGAGIVITVSFNKAVNVTGTPQLALNSGGSAGFSGGSGSTLTFTYSVLAGQNTSHLDYSSSGALTLNGGTINGTSGTAANLTLPAPGSAGSLGANKSIVIDTTAPTVVSYSVLFGTKSFNVIGSGRTRLPWQITGISVVFSKPIASGDINSLTGVAATGFVGLGTNTLTWSISPVVDANLATVLQGTGADALKDAAGNGLSGGSGFSQLLKVLWGDVNDDGIVNASDINLVLAATKQTYNIFDDMNGDGVVDINDYIIVRSRNGTTLP